jgi:hypothetical protein
VENPVLTEIAREAARRTGLKLVELHYMRTQEREQECKETRKSLDAQYVYDAGPREFLTYIRDAQLVLTNSFHGTVFSILFEKKFYSVYETNGRIENLLGFLGLSDRHITGKEQLKPEEAIAYADAAERLEAYRHVSESFLTEALQP